MSAHKQDTTFTNSLGMVMVRIEPGSFVMGQRRAPGWDDIDAMCEAQDRPGIEGWIANATHTDWDETPLHQVTISRSFHMAATEVTNAQYEQFAPEHKQLRGKDGFSSADDEAVVFVSWHEAVAFCAWLSEREGKPYRLPTEAEWEYACRAGTQTLFSTGDDLPEAYHKSQRYSWEISAIKKPLAPTSLRVGQTPANPWGLYDMHGNVEEWCLDWYGTYTESEQVDPVGRAAGLFRITRGGSHNTYLRYLRSANRLATHPDDRSPLIGFRIVCAPLPAGAPLPADEPPLFQRRVSQEQYHWPEPSKEPFFLEPLHHVQFGRGPFVGWHNHEPGITWCQNGDLLAVHRSCHFEYSRSDIVQMAARLRPGRNKWECASPVMYPADRNTTSHSLWHDGRGKLYYFCGLGDADNYSRLALLKTTSTDNGATWTTPELVDGEHNSQGNQVIHGMIETREGYLILPADYAVGSAIRVSKDGGRTWELLNGRRPTPLYIEGGVGHCIAGIHARIVQRADGSLLAFGRAGNINNRMPMSVSYDMGRTWTYAASPFPPIGGGQRLVLRRLNEGPLLFVGFTDEWRLYGNPFGADIVRVHSPVFKFDAELVAGRLRAAGIPEDIVNKIDHEKDYVNWSKEAIIADVRQRIGAAGWASYGARILDVCAGLQAKGMVMLDARNREQRCYGMYAAVSFDDGATWPVKRLLSPGGPARWLTTFGWMRSCMIDDTHAELGGYLAETQTPDGVIHLLSSGVHYRFNLPWLLQGKPLY